MKREKIYLPVYSSLGVLSDWVIRSLFNVLLDLFQNSLTKPPEDIDSPGRSGARMMMSHDKKYFIKTLVSEEVEQLHLILKQYHQVYIMKKTYTELWKVLLTHRSFGPTSLSDLPVRTNIYRSESYLKLPQILK